VAYRVICFCLPFLFVFFLLVLHLSLTLQNIDPLRFQAGGHRRQPNQCLVCIMLMLAVYLVKDACLLSAWCGFTKASDRQRINTVIDRARRLGYCSPDLLTFDELCDIADDELFSKFVRQSNHILHPLLPPPSTASQHYNLRDRVHSLQLPEHATQLYDFNFLTRMLYKKTC